MAEHDQKDAAKSAAGKKGGRARAEALTPEERTVIASEAAKMRWSGDPLPQAACGSPDRPLRIGNIEIPCYVLSDSRRVIVNRGMIKALGVARGTAGAESGDRITALVRSKSLNQFVPIELELAITHPIKFRTSGGIAFGYEATVLADLCDVVLTARKEGQLHPQQEHIAAQCEILVRSFAKVGIIALVDEATGFQDVRARDALAKILERFIAAELQKWVRTFQPEFYRELFRLRGWPYSPVSTKRAVLVGKLTNNIVYQRLAPGVLEELKRVTPKDETGRHKNKLFQRLTTDVGHPRLREHLAAVTALMKISKSWDGFMRSLDVAFPKFGTTGTLAFMADKE